MWNWLKRLFSRKQPDDTLPIAPDELIKRAKAREPKQDVSWEERPKFWGPLMSRRRKDLEPEALKYVEEVERQKGWRFKHAIGTHAIFYETIVQRLTGTNRALQEVYEYGKRWRGWLSGSLLAWASCLAGGVFSFIWLCALSAGNVHHLWPALIWPAIHFIAPVLWWVKKTRAWWKEEHARIAQFDDVSVRSVHRHAQHIPALLAEHIERMKESAIGEHSPSGKLLNRLQRIKDKYLLMLGFFEDLIRRECATEVDHAELERVQESIRRAESCIESVERQKAAFVRMFGAITARFPVVEQHLRRHIMVHERIALDRELGHIEGDVAELTATTARIIEHEMTRINKALASSTEFALGLPAAELTDEDIRGTMEQLVAHEERITAFTQDIEKEFAQPDAAYA